MLQELLAGDVGVADVETRAALAAQALAASGFRPKTVHNFECRGPDGELKWAEEVENLTTYAGLADMLSKYWLGANYTAAFYVGLKGTGTIAGTDTMASHAGWSEVTGYSQAARPTLTLGAVTSGATASVDNSANKATFSITASITAAGAFVATNSTVGGTTGTLVGASDFSQPRTMGAGDSLTVTVTLTAVTG